jgi:hypothetical protein
MLLTEWQSFDSAAVKCVTEANESGSGKNLYLTGIFVQGGKKNHNGRVYPVSEIRSAVNDITKRIDENGGVLGECDHPEGLTINLDRVSHTINKMWMEGDNGMGKLKMLDTPKGLIIKTLVDSGVRLGVSSRGSGDVDHRGNVSDFEIITVDVVANPSAQEAYPRPIYEALQRKRGVRLEELAEAVAHDPKAQKHFHKEILGFITNHLQ